MNVASTGAVDLGTTSLLADTAVGDGVDYTINASGAVTDTTLDFGSNDGAMDIEINSLANDVTVDVSMNDVQAGTDPDNDVASSLVVERERSCRRSPCLRRS